MTPALEQLATSIRDAGAPVRVVGGGSWLHGGGPWADATPLPVQALRGIVEYTPGDLVITAWAGTTMAELAAVTGAEGQMLAIAPYGSAQSTIGAVVATPTAAPLAFGDHTVRDLVLGLQVVMANGEVTRAGGRVVKNVAGFDLVRLHTGAYGTLGVITEVSLRLHARPAVDRVVAGSVPGDTGALDEVLPRLIANRAPLPMLLRRLPGGGWQLWARLSGNPARAAALQRHLTAIGVPDLREVATPDVSRLLQDTPPMGVVLRARTHRSDAVPFVRAAHDSFPQATMDYDPARGSLRVVLPASAAATLDDDVAAWVRRAVAGGASHPVSVVVDQGCPPGSGLARARTPLEERVKRAFDPHDRLNRLAPTPAAFSTADSPAPVRG